MPTVTDAPDAGSFRDPSGFVFQRDGVVLRQVNHAFGDRWEDLKRSGLLVTLQQEDLLIGHEEVGRELAYAPATAYTVLRPEQLAFVSYPYEWSFSQLKDAALVTLEAQSVAASTGSPFVTPPRTTSSCIEDDRSSSTRCRSNGRGRTSPGVPIASSASTSWHPSR